MAANSNQSGFGGEYMVQDQDHMAEIRPVADKSNRGGVRQPDQSQAGASQQGGDQVAAKQQGGRKRQAQ